MRQMTDKLVEISNAIRSPSVKVVSFDVFDTLLIRPCLQPTDLFHIVASRLEPRSELSFRFVEVRRTAEERVRAKIRTRFPTYEDINLDEIYEEISDILQLNPEDTCAAKQIEIDVEAAYLEPRRLIAPLYFEARRLNKRVIVVADTYLPARTISHFLSKSGYDAFDNVFVSSEVRLSKGEGGLFPRVLYEMGACGPELVHVGNDQHADVHCAEVCGIRSFRVPKVTDSISGRKVWSQIVHDRDTLEPGFCLMLGFAAGMFYDGRSEVGADSDDTFLGDPYIIGSTVLGPFILQVALWLIEKADNDDVEHLVFVARQGFLFLKAYNAVRRCFSDSPSTSYLRVPASSRYPLDGEEGSNTAKSHLGPSSVPETAGKEAVEPRSSMALDKGLLETPRANGIDLDASINVAREFSVGTRKSGDTVLSRLEEQRELELHYLRQEIPDVKRLAIFDSGCSMRVQGIFQQFAGNIVTGFYLAPSEYVCDRLSKDFDVRNFMSLSYNRMLEGEEFSLALLETLVSEFEVGSVEWFEKRGKGIFTCLGKREYDVVGRSTISEVHRGCMDFVNGFISRFRSDLHVATVSEGSASFLLRNFMNDPSGADAQVFRGITFSNGASNAVGCLIGESEHQSIWKAGFKAVQRQSLGVPDKAASDSLRWATDRHEPYAKYPGPAGGGLYAKDDAGEARRILQDYERLLKTLPRRFRDPAWATRLEEETNPWTRVMLRHPLRIAYWWDLCRMQRRRKRAGMTVQRD